MTKRNFTIILVLCVLVAVGMFYGGKKIPSTPDSPPLKTLVPPAPDSTPPVLRKDGREIVGLPPDSPPEVIESIEPDNEPSDQWRGNFESALKRQGGSALKDIQVTRERSYILVQNGLTLNVESTLVQLTNQKDEVTTFRALVDSETGKILQTWDQPVTDPIDPREEFRIKLDPRHFEN